MHRVQAVDIVGEVGWAVAHDAAGFRDGVGPAAVLEFVHRQHAHAAVAAEIPHIPGVDGAANADLDDAFRVQQTFLDRAAEGGTVMEAGAEIVVASVAMGVDMDHADRAGGGDGAQDGQGDGMVAADGKRGDAGGDDRVVEGRDFRQRGFEFIRFLDPGIAEVAHAGLGEGHDAGGAVDAAEQAGLVAHRARAVAGAGAVGDTAIEGHADDADIHRGEVLGVAGAEEGGDAGVARMGLWVGQVRVAFRGFEHGGGPLRGAGRTDTL